METNKYIIKKEFLEPQKYQQLHLHTLNSRELFAKWLVQISNNYKGFSKPQALKNSHITESDSFNSLIFPFINKIYEISTQHLKYISNIFRQSTSISLQKQTERVIQKISQLNEHQVKFQGIYRDILSAENRISMHPSQNIEFYYYSNWFKRLNALEKYKKAMKTLPESKSDKQKLYSLSEEVQIQLLHYRKKVIDYKYGYLKHGVKLSRQLLKCLSQYLTIGIQILSKINGKLKMESAIGFRKSMSLTDSYNRTSLTDHMSDFRQNYEAKTQAFRNTLTNIRSIFSLPAQKFDKKVLFEEFLQMYSGNEHLLEEMFDTFNIFEMLSSNRKIMYDKIDVILNIIEAEYKQKKRQAEVLQTLTKRKSLQELRNSNYQSYQLDTKTIQRSIGQVIQYSLKCFSQLSELCYKMSSKSTQQRLTQNNMSISYQYKQIKVKSKRPSKQQIWLWKDWREFREYPEVVVKFDQKTVSKQLEYISKIMQDGSAELKISCMIEGRKSGKAYMEISPQKIQIIRKKDSSINLILPFQQIQYVQPQKKRLLIKMDGGAQLKLSQFKNLVEVQKKINDYYLEKRGPTNASKPKVARASQPVITVTPEQLEAIKKRESQFGSLKTNLTDFVKYGQTKFNNATIQQVYENLFSDKRGCAISKNQGFSEYFNLKSGNQNFKITNFDKQGPYFYNGVNKDITFVNCPSSSSHELQFDHPLPPIPFIPKSIHCKAKQSILWISNKQLQIHGVASSYGHKLMQSFHTETVYKVVEQNDGVSLQVFSKVEFKQGATMKSLLLSGAQGQIKKLIPDMIKQMQKCMKIAIRNRAQDTGEQAHQQSKKDLLQQQKSSSINLTKIQQKKTINKTLIILIVGTILINILINIIIF